MDITTQDGNISTPKTTIHDNTNSGSANEHSSLDSLSAKLDKLNATLLQNQESLDKLKQKLQSIEKEQTDIRNTQEVILKEQEDIGNNVSHVKVNLDVLMKDMDTIIQAIPL